MMIQSRDTGLVEDTTYSALHAFNAEQLYTFLRIHMVTMVGTCIGIFLSGIAVSLGVSSILLFVSKGKALSRRDCLLCAYTTILLLLLIAFEAQVFVFFNAPTILFFRPDNGPAVDSVTKALFVTVAIIALLTDGLLALRCFLVQRALGHSPLKWGNLFWIFPACLCGFTFVTAVLAGVENGAIHTMPLGALALISNFALNIYATLFITTRLLLHRRMVMTCTGNKSLTAQHMYIIGILLESAALNLPISAAAVVCQWVKSDVGEGITLPTFAASQVLAAILIIYQTALGRVFSRQKEAELSELVEMREHGISGSEESGV